MCPVPVVPNWFDSHQYVALWLEGIALLLIFIWDRIDASQQHEQTVAQIRASEAAATAANKSAEALINSERAWVIAELIPLCTKFKNGRWHRRVGDGWTELNSIEILDGYFRMHTLRFTNMGRTPAHILQYQISYSCLGKGVTTLSEGAASKQVSLRTFDNLLGAGNSVEVPEPIDVESYIGEYMEGIRQLENTAVFHGWVQYQHVFSGSEILEEPFCYSFKSSEDALVKIIQPKSGKQKQPPN